MSQNDTMERSHTVLFVLRITIIAILNGF